jgi:hypothetical protein
MITSRSDASLTAGQTRDCEIQPLDFVAPLYL